MFDVWCERKKLLGDLDMAEAIASFLHLSFVCNLKYPKVRNSQFLVRPFFLGPNGVCALPLGFLGRTWWPLLMAFFLFSVPGLLFTQNGVCSSSEMF